MLTLYLLTFFYMNFIQFQNHIKYQSQQHFRGVQEINILLTFNLFSLPLMPVSECFGFELRVNFVVTLKNDETMMNKSCSKNDEKNKTE